MAAGVILEARERGWRLGEQTHLTGLTYWADLRYYTYWADLIYYTYWAHLLGRPEVVDVNDLEVGPG